MKALDHAGGAWAPQGISAYGNHLMESARGCPLQGEARAAAAKDLMDLAAARFRALVELGGGGAGRIEPRQGVRKKLAWMGDLPKESNAREGAAWAALAHFQAEDARWKASAGATLEANDYEGWALDLQDQMRDLLHAGRGICRERGEIWTARWASLGNLARDHKHEGASMAATALSALEATALLAQLGRWDGLGGRHPSAPWLAMHVAALEQQWLAWGRARSQKERLPKTEREWMSSGREFCQSLGRALAMDQDGAALALEVAGMLSHPLGSLVPRFDGAGIRWAGLEGSSRAMGSSPWVAALLAGACEAGSNALIARDAMGRSVGGMLNAALREHISEGRDPWDKARGALAREWLEEAVLRMLGDSPEAGEMLVPKASFHALAANEKIRMAAERAELAQASKATASAPSRAAKRL